MKWQQLKAIAKRNGLVRWTRSGIFERLSIFGKTKVLAKGPASPSHVIRQETDSKQNFDCVEIPPKQCFTIGEMLFPVNVPYQFLQQEHHKTQRDIACMIERKREKRDLKICKNIMES
jgi:hypothetical protein